MINLVHKQSEIEVVCPVGGATSGDVVIIGALLGIAKTTAAAGEQLAIETQGVFDLAKQAALAINEGDEVYWDTGASECDKTSTNTPIGVCVADAAASATKVKVKLHGRVILDSADYLTLADAASTAASKGASLIGVEDAATKFAGADVEAVLLEIAAAVRRVGVTVQAEAANVIALDLQIKDFGGDNVSEIVGLHCELFDSSMLEALVGAFTAAETGAGAEDTTTGRPGIIITTDANGAAQLSVTDVAGGSGAVIVVKITPLERAGSTEVKLGVPTTVSITFD